MLGLRDGYMMVGLDPGDESSVVITGEDPRLVVTIHDPLRQSEVRAGLKFFHDPDKQKDYAFLFLRGEPERDAFGIPTGEWTKARRLVATREQKYTGRRLRFKIGRASCRERVCQHV